MGTQDAQELRRERGLAIAAVCRIEKKHDQWIVPSQGGSGSYRVNPNPLNPTVPLCTCDDYATRGQPCKHVYAVRAVIERAKNPEVPSTIPKPPTTPARTVAERRTYKQDWPAYNRAQTNEKSKFQQILFDLCRAIPDPPAKPGPGRKPLRMADVVFIAAFKVFATLSARRFMSDLADAHAKGYIAKVPHFNAISKTLECPTLTPILRALIAESSLPLKAVEVDFAADSSGFSTSRFIRWFDIKYGKPVQEHDWIKVHIMTGVKTNIVTAVEIHGRDAGDSPQFRPMLATTAKNFHINEVSADGAYVSYDNMEAVAQCGGTPYMLFKSSSVGTEGVYGKMLHYYRYRRDEFLNHYHKRSNVETTFSMVKAKFGDSLRSKTDVAMVNEALCKILCHNICCLIQSMYELGVNPVFWVEEEIAAPEPIAAETGADVDQLMSMFAWV